MLPAHVEPRDLHVTALHALFTEEADTAVRSILRDAVRAAGFELAIAWRLDREAYVLRCVATWQDPERPGAPVFEADSMRMTFSYGEGLPGLTWARAATTFMHDLASEPLFVRRSAAAVAGLQSAVAFPIHLGGEIIGVAEFYDRKGHVPDAPELGTLLALEAPLALGITRVAGAEDRGRVDRSLGLLLDVGEALGDAAELAPRLARVASRAAAWIGGFCLVHLLDATGARLVAVDHEDPEKAALLRQPCMYRSPALDSTKSPLARVIRTGVAHVLPETSDAMLAATMNDAEALAVLRAVSITAGMLVPIVWQGRALGALTLAASRADRRILRTDVKVAEELARKIALAVLSDRAAQGEREAALAREEHDRLYRASQAAVRAREDLLAIVSHDLRNPLVAIKLSATQLGREAEGDARVKGKTALILRSADRMDRMIRDLLDASRIETGGLALTVAREDVRLVVQEAIDHFKPLAAPKGIQIEEELPDEPLFAEVDRERVLQVLWNLVGNAIKFTPEGGVVTLRLRREGSSARIDVADSGPGIRSDHLPHVFDRYFHAETNKATGTGLGLFIADGLVRAHGGTIHVESEPGVGARFWFTLPIEGAG